MAQKEFIAVKSDGLSHPGDPRYIVINRETREVVDDAHGNGYKSPKAAHSSFAFKHRQWTPKPAGTTNERHSPTPRRKHQDATPSLFDNDKPIKQ